MLGGTFAAMWNTMRKLVIPLQQGLFVFVLLVQIVCSTSWAQSSKENNQKNQTAAYYEPEISTLSGTVFAEIFPGPPEYFDIKQGDKPEKFWILKLNKPITVSAKNGDEEQGVCPLERNVTRLQLVFNFPTVSPQKFGLHSGKVIAVTGTLFHSITIHHRTDVLVFVEKISPVK